MACSYIRMLISVAAPAPGVYRIKLTSKGVEDAEVKLYCTCRQPYDASKFYIECDECSVSRPKPDPN